MIDNKRINLVWGGGSKNRQSNIELCRIAAIFMVMLLHSDFQVFGWPKSLDDTSVGLILLESFCIIAVNVFLLITGFFSTKPKVNSIINLFYICLFVGIFKVLFDLYMGNPISWKRWFFFTRSNWFIPTYLGLVLFSPILNAFCEKASKKALSTCIVILLGYETYMAFFPAMPQIPIGFEHGCSVLSFMILYLIGRYICLYGVPNYISRFSTLIYIGCSVLLAIIEFVALKLNLGEYSMYLYDYTNPLIIFASICFFLSFSKYDIGSNNIINHLSKSVLSVLLIHASGTAMRYINPHYEYMYNQFSGITLFLLWGLTVFILFIFSVCVDQIRLWSYKSISKYLFKHDKKTY